MLKKIFLLLSILLISSFLALTKVEAFTPLDLINNYEITISENKDGSLNLEYYIKWTVLNSTLEGPVTWIEIGIPNKHCKNVEALTDNINRAYYYDDSGSYIRLNLDRSYYNNETFEVRFKLIQERIYTINGDYIEYAFMPGWFNEIEVESIIVRWKKTTDVLYSNYDTETEEYYIFNNGGEPLEKGETITCDMRFDSTHFNKLSKRNAYISYETEEAIKIIIIFCSIVAVIIGIIVVSARAALKNSDGYDYYTGFSGRYYWYHHYIPCHNRRGYSRHGIRHVTGRTNPALRSSSGGHSSGGHGGGCACACACACAGGGRAGCSRKDFYHNMIKIEDIDKTLSED